MKAGSEWVLAWLSLGLGLMGMAGALVGPGARASAAQRSRLLLLGGSGLLLALLAFLATRANAFPFEPGGRLGAGILLGAGAGLLYWLAAAFGAEDAVALATAGAGAATTALAGVMLLYRGYPDPALWGVPLGMGTALLWVEHGGPTGAEETRPGSGDAAPDEPSTRGGGAGDAASNGAVVGVLVAAALAAALFLAIHRYAGLPPAERLAAGEKSWWIVPLLFAAAIVPAGLVARLLRGRPAAGTLAGGAVAFVLLGFFLSLVRGRGGMTAPPSGWHTYAWLLLPFAAGWVTALLVGGLAKTVDWGLRLRGSESGVRTNPQSAIRNPQSHEPGAILAVLLLLALLGAAYRAPAGALDVSAAHPALAGYGITLAALGFLLAAPLFLAPRSAVARLPARVFLLGAAMLVSAAAFRVFYERYDLDDSGIRLSAHYVLIGLGAGIAAPFGLAIAGRAMARGGLRGALLRGAVLVLLAALLPALLVIFWGTRAGGGLLVGLAGGFDFALLIALLEPPPGAGAAGQIAAGLPLIPTLLTVWVTLLALGPLDYFATHWPRSVRIGIAAGLALLFAASSFLHRRSSREVN
jgi:hypothetical protein